MSYTIDWVQLTEEQVEKIIKDHNKKINRPPDRYFFPWANQEYRHLVNQGWRCIETSNKYWNESIFKTWVFKTQAQAEEAARIRTAVVAIWKYCQDNNLHFEPDWEDGN